jgi:hypothetical protein
LLHCPRKYVVQYDVVASDCCINDLVGIVVSQFPLTAKVSFDPTNPTPRRHVCISSRVYDRFRDDRQSTNATTLDDTDCSEFEPDDVEMDGIVPSGTAIVQVSTLECSPCYITDHPPASYQSKC